MSPRRYFRPPFNVGLFGYHLHDDGWSNMGRVHEDNGHPGQGCSRAHGIQGWRPHSYKVGFRIMGVHGMSEEFGTRVHQSPEAALRASSGAHVATVPPVAPPVGTEGGIAATPMPSPLPPIFPVRAENDWVEVVKKEDGIIGDVAQCRDLARREENNGEENVAKGHQ